MAKTPVEGGQGTLRSEDIVCCGFGGRGIGRLSMLGNWMMRCVGMIDWRKSLPRVACMRYVSEGLNVSEAESFEARCVCIEPLA